MAYFQYLSHCKILIPVAVYGVLDPDPCGVIPVAVYGVLDPDPCRPRRTSASWLGQGRSWSSCLKTQLRFTKPVLKKFSS